MDRRERLGNLFVALRTFAAGWQSGIWTALPGIVQSFDPQKVTVTVQPAVQGRLQAPDGSWTDDTLPLCADVPVLFQGVGGFGLTFPIAQGDEGLLVFCGRCLDAWHQSGGVQKQADVRMHSLSDAIFVPGLFSLPRVPSPVSMSGTQLRSSDGQNFVEVGPQEITASPDGGTTKIKLTPGVIALTALNVTVNGNLAVNGNFSGTGTASGPGGVNLFTHRHAGVTTGSGSTLGPET